MKHFELVITKHKGLLEYLSEEGYTWDEHIEHVSNPEVLTGKTVLGVLPVHLAAKCEEFSELQLDLPAELRGKELDSHQVRQYQRGVRSFVVIECFDEDEAE